MSGHPDDWSARCNRSQLRSDPNSFSKSVRLRAPFLPTTIAVLDFLAIEPRNTKMIALWIIILFTVAAPIPGVAQPGRYVSDQLEITLRSGPGTKFAIRRMLKSGAPLQLVEENEAGYSKVTTADGIDGWVLSRFLLDEPVARDRLAENEALLQNMQQENALMQEQFSAVQQLQTDLSQAMDEKRVFQAELEQVKGVAADTMVINAENDKLKRDLEESRAKAQALIEESGRLSKEADQTWFLTGAGVIIMGMLIGLAIPKIRWKQRRSSTGGINIDI